jgi:hypothetical protein
MKIDEPIKSESNLSVIILWFAIAIFSIGAYGFELKPPIKQYWSDIFWTVFSLLAVGQSYRATVSLKGNLKTAWAMFTLGSFFWFMGMLFWDYNELILGKVAPFPTWSDLGFLLYAVLFFFGFFFYRADGDTAEVPWRKVAGIGTVIFAYLLTFVLEFARDIVDGEFDVTYLLTAIGWSVFYFAAAISAIYRLILMTSWPHIRILSLLLVSIILQTFVGTVYAATMLDFDYQAGSYLDVLWLIALALDFTSASKQLQDRKASLPPIESKNHYLTNTFDAFTTIGALSILAVVFFFKSNVIDASTLKIILPISFFLILTVKGRVNLYHRGGVKVYHSG